MDSTHIERLQRIHFESIGAQYQAHYGDAYSQEYRMRFIYEPMSTGIDLSSRRVLEAMSGDGQATGFLLSRGGKVTGLDISASQIEAFKKRWPTCDARCASIFDTRLTASSFDCVFIVGGLHHLHPRVNDALREIHRLLAPNGYLAFAEPHRGSIFDIARRFWYKHDSLFAPNEASVDLNDIEQHASSMFEFKKRIFLGNAAYLFVLNSMVFRLPVKLKRFYAAPVMALEKVVNRFQGPRSSCFVICQWRKK
ncbi:MAG TPA: class I SAM-dependent methyltransferase [Pyrinomonadaceae bacterium]|nr:class I SAM-dependent methyltransferase [Pyrinomonadaceae bacterium]